MNTRMEKSIIRVLIVLFWTLCIFLFLFIPKILESFRTQKSITILSWPEVLSVDYLQDFEKETGIKVYITYFENNEELFVKLKEAGGSGYDIIMPTDYVVTLLKKQGMLKKLDKAKLNFWPELYPGLLGHYFDPNNDYTIPFYWGIYGIGYDVNQFGGIKPPATWKLVFDKNFHPKCMGMVNDVREMILLAALYLYGSVDNITIEQVPEITALLLEQKKWVSVYTDLRTEYVMLTNTCPVAVVLSSDISRALRYHENLGFLLPEEGSFAVIDSFAITSSTQKEEYVYSFLNYLYKKEVMQLFVDRFGFFPPTKNITSPATNFEFSQPTVELFNKLHFFKTSIPEEVLNQIWIALKS